MQRGAPSRSQLTDVRQLDGCPCQRHTAPCLCRQLLHLAIQPRLPRRVCLHRLVSQRLGQVRNLHTTETRFNVYTLSNLYALRLSNLYLATCTHSDLATRTHLPACKPITVSQVTKLKIPTWISFYFLFKGKKHCYPPFVLLHFKEARTCSWVGAGVVRWSMCCSPRETPRGNARTVS